MVCSYRCFYRCSIYYNLYYNTAIKVVKNGVTEENKNKIKHVFKPYFNCISAVLQFLSRIFGNGAAHGAAILTISIFKNRLINTAVPTAREYYILNDER